MSVESISMQIKRLEKKLKAVAEKEVPRAVVTALNKVGKPLASSVAKEVAAKEKIPTKLVRKQVVFNKATVNRRAAYIKSFTRGINAIRLLSPAVVEKSMGRGTNKSGVTVRGRIFRGAFINRAQKNGNAFVFERRGKGRYPIDVKRIAIDEALLNIQPKLARDKFRENFNKYYAHELQFRLSKYGR